MLELYPAGLEMLNVASICLSNEEKVRLWTPTEILCTQWKTTNYHIGIFEVLISAAIN